MKNENRKIEATLLALLTISVDQYLRNTGIAKPKERSIDRMLSEVGLSVKEIAALLGKTERAVQIMLATESNKRGGKGNE